MIGRRLLPAILRSVQSERRLSHAIYENLTPISQKSLIWRADEQDPRKHTKEHEGLYYLLPDETQITQMFGYPSPFDPVTARFYKTIGMTPIMIRQPSLTAMDYMRQIQPDSQNIRLLFYGDKGQGKAHTLSHLLHYLHLQQEYVIVQIREMKRFTRSPFEMAASSSRPGRLDTPFNAALVLAAFRTQNAAILEKYKDKLVCTRDYTWSLREATKAGEPLTNVVEHGLNRVIHASDCLAVLLKELTLAADAGKVKLASVLYNVKLLFAREAGVLKHADRKNVLVDEITVARALKKLIRGNYKNGLVLASCVDMFSGKIDQTLQDAIGPEGWKHFDPFLPVHVPKFSRKEFESCMNHYQDIGWLTRPESRTREVRDEIRFISGLNPREVRELCKAI